MGALVWVQRLAAYDCPQDIAADLKARHGVTISPYAVRYYDPTTCMGSKLPERWTRLFEERLAAFDDPHEIAVALRERFGIDLSVGGIRHYDPTRFRGRRLAKRWRELFTATRRRILARQGALGAEVAALRHEEALGGGKLKDGLKALEAKLPRRTTQAVEPKPVSVSAPSRQLSDEEIDEKLRGLLSHISRDGMEMLIREFGERQSP